MNDAVEFENFAEDENFEADPLEDLEEDLDLLASKQIGAVNALHLYSLLGSMNQLTLKLVTEFQNGTPLLELVRRHEEILTRTPPSVIPLIARTCNSNFAESLVPVPKCGCNVPGKPRLQVPEFVSDLNAVPKNLRGNPCIQVFVREKLCSSVPPFQLDDIAYRLSMNMGPTLVDQVYWPTLNPETQAFLQPFVEAKNLDSFESQLVQAVGLKKSKCRDLDVATVLAQYPNLTNGSRLEDLDLCPLKVRYTLAVFPYFQGSKISVDDQGRVSLTKMKSCSKRTKPWKEIPIGRNTSFAQFKLQCGQAFAEDDRSIDDLYHLYFGNDGLHFSIVAAVLLDDQSPVACHHGQQMFEVYKKLIPIGEPGVFVARNWQLPTQIQSLDFLKAFNENTIVHLPENFDGPLYESSDNVYEAYAKFLDTDLTTSTVALYRYAHENPSSKFWLLAPKNFEADHELDPTRHVANHSRRNSQELRLV